MFDFIKKHAFKIQIIFASILIIYSIVYMFWADEDLKSKTFLLVLAIIIGIISYYLFYLLLFLQSKNKLIPQKIWRFGLMFFVIAILFADIIVNLDFIIREKTIDIIMLNFAVAGIWNSTLQTIKKSNSD